MIAAIVFIGFLTLDQISKHFARIYLSQPVIVISDFLRFVYVQNNGAAFSIFSGGGATIYFIVATTIAIVLFSILLYKFRLSHWLASVGISAILSGAIGNLIDRIFFDGYVTDFIDFYFINFAVFNIADVALCLGVACFAVFYIFVYKEEDNAKGNSVTEQNMIQENTLMDEQTTKDARG